VDNNVPKPVRIRRWTGPLAQKSVRFKSRSPGTTLCVMQMQQFPHGAHDDGPDSAETARRKALELLASGIQSDGDILES
jgi:phage terminase large subunit-like protein